jgi:hypothetical protein
MSNFQQDFFEANLTVEESKGEVDGVNILGKIKGQFFVPNGVSRNNRYYPKSLWEKQLSRPDIKKRLSERRMFGTISHDQPLDDQALLSGKISHIVTSLSIDSQGRGMGEALILNTDAGRVLNTILRAGGKLFVSSRATGKFQGERDGVPVVDEKTYSLNTFDVVMDPGFLEANPQLAESMKQLFNEIEEDKRKNKMGDVNTDLIRENQDLKRDTVDLAAENKNLSEAVKTHESTVSAKDAEIAKLQEKVDSLVKYEEFGSVDEIDEALNLSKTKNEELASEITELKKVNEAYAELGSVDEITKVIEVAESNKEELDAFKELGTFDEVSKVIDFAESVVNEREDAGKEKEIADLASELGVDKEVIEKVHGKMDIEEIKSLVAGLKESSSWTPSKKNGDEEETNEETNSSYKTERAKPRATAIMEGMYKKAPKNK